MDIIELEGTEPEWKEFLSTYDHFIFHTSEYKFFIQHAFHCAYRFVAVKDNGVMKTALPIVEVKSLLFGNKIISSAYIEYGGFVGEEQHVPLLIDFLSQRYGKNNRYLEIRGGIENYDAYLSTRLLKRSWYKRFVLQLGDEGEVWKRIQESKRKAVKKALKKVEVKEVPPTDIDLLYQLYAENMRRFGSPPYDKNYFLCFYQHLVEKGLGKMYGSYYQGKLVSALLGFCYQDRVHILIAVSDPRYQEYRPNDAMHWSFIRWACQQQYQWFDFGRVREDSGQFEYKQKWGPVLMDLPSYFLLWKAKEIPLLDPSSSHYGFLAALWRKMPLPFTKLVGHRLRKGIGI